MTIRTGWNSSVLLTDEELEELKKAQEKLEQEQKVLLILEQYQIQELAKLKWEKEIKIHSDAR